MDDLISRQQAIDALDKRFDNIPMEQTTEILQLRRDLRQLPSAEPTFDARDTQYNLPIGTDLISRQALLDKFEPWLNVKDYNDGELNMLKAILYEIRFMPSAEPKRGWWIEIINSRGVVVALRCSRCEKSPRHGVRSDFCPNCGAYMREVTT